MIENLFSSIENYHISLMHFPKHFVPVTVTVINTMTVTLTVTVTVTMWLAHLWSAFVPIRFWLFVLVVTSFFLRGKRPGLTMITGARFLKN
jgi:hypothetical protein